MLSMSEHGGKLSICLFSRISFGPCSLVKWSPVRRSQLWPC